MSIDEMLADPIVGALMAADGVVPDQLRALLRSVAEAIGQHNPAGAPGKALARLASLFGATLRARDFPQAANRGSGNVRRARITPADYSSLSIAPLGTTPNVEPQCPARS
ncbi:MAG: hypothetical protein WAK67_10505 [Xanthobacteraceae bacterium]